MSISNKEAIAREAAQQINVYYDKLLGVSPTRDVDLGELTPSQRSTGDQLMTDLTHCRNADGDEVGKRITRCESSASPAQNNFQGIQ